MSGGNMACALETSKRCVVLAERNNNPEILSAAQMQLAGAARLSGDLVQASVLFGELVKRTRSAPEGTAAELLPFNLWVEAPADLALIRHVLGRPDEALKLSGEALWRARQLKQPFTLAMALGCSAALRYYRREPEMARAPAEALVALAEQHGFGDWATAGRVFRGMVQRSLGDQAVAELEAEAALISSVLQMLVSATLAQMYVDVGRTDRALHTLDEALARGERTGLLEVEAELHRLKGEAILIRDSQASGEAETCYRKAIEIARGQSAKWWELRATLGLVRLLRDTNRRDEARTMLAGIYNWFTEGFDTGDLKEAKALLDELSTG